MKNVEIEPRRQADSSRSPAIERKPKPGVLHNGYDRLPSQDLADWYSPQDSARFAKRVLQASVLVPGAKRAPVFIEATEWGEVLALADAPYLQGVGDDRRGPRRGRSLRAGDCLLLRRGVPREPCRRAEVERAARPDGVRDVRRSSRRVEPGLDLTAASAAKGRQRRAILPAKLGYSAKVGNGGNDYPFGYLFPSKADRRHADDWQGGVDVAVLAGAEERALGWHEWFKQNTPEGSTRSRSC